MATKPVVAVAMSGGVDSSVSAALLVDQGYQVFGIMLRLWSEPGNDRSNRCCTPDSVAAARQVATTLSIPFYVLDAKQIFYDQVVLPFVHDYTNNLTPNPCIICNRLVRWGYLYNYARAAGADFLATGHYARILKNGDGTSRLLRGVDERKDQSYVLHILHRDQLAHALFPLGEYQKYQVRDLARSYNLPVAERPDSQDLCFIGSNGDYRQFLIQHAPGSLVPGEIVDVQGKILGRHEGLALYTIGQRKGLRISATVPHYVLEKDLSGNRIIVGSHGQAAKDHLIATNVNWIAGEPPPAPFDAQIKIRYKAYDIPGYVSIIDNYSIKVQFQKPVIDITPGQAAVLYNGDVCLGGGTISSYVV